MLTYKLCDRVLLRQLEYRVKDTGPGVKTEYRNDYMLGKDLFHRTVFRSKRYQAFIFMILKTSAGDVVRLLDPWEVHTKGYMKSHIEQC